MINGSCWLGYGLAVSDPFIWVPNGIGAMTGTLQLVLIGILPRRAHDKQSPAPSEADTTSSQRQLVPEGRDGVKAGSDEP